MEKAKQYTNVYKLYKITMKNMILKKIYLEVKY